MASPPISSLTRHSREFPCPVCSGYAAMPKGRGERCAGFTLDFVSYCQRGEYAGRALLDITTEPPTYKHHLFGPCPCGGEHGAQQERKSRRPSQPRRVEHELSLESRHAIFGAAIARLGLRREALENLRGRRLSRADIESVGYRSIPDYSELNAFLRGLVDEFGETLLRQCPGFTDKNGRTFFWSAGRSQSGYRDGFVVPYRNEDGLITGMQLKRLEDGRYETARHSVIAEIYHVAGHVESGCDCYVTEGGLKAEVASRLGGITVIGLPGQALSPQHVAALSRLQPGRVIEALDQEANEDTDRARERWLQALIAARLPTYRGVWEGSDAGGPKGLDDLFASGGRPRIRFVTHVPPATGEKRILRQVASRGAIDAGVPLAEARRRTRDKIDAFVAKVAKRPMRALLISSSPGSGKTTALAKAVRREGVSARIVTGNLKLAREMSAEHGYALIEGRNESNCQRHDVVRALGDAGHDVEKLACGSDDKPRCPFRSGCPYYLQFQQPGPRVGAAEQMFNRHFLAGGSLLVVDDADLPRSLISRYVVSAEELGMSYKQLKGKKRANLRTFFTILGHAVLSVPLRADGASQALTGSAAWDHLARSARLYGSDIVALLESLPQKPSLPEPEADHEGILSKEAVEQAPPGTLLELLNALRDEVDAFNSFEDFNSRLRLTRDGIEVRRLKEHVRDRWGAPLVGQMDMLVLDATPVTALVDYLTQHHERLPDVGIAVRLPENVKVRQYATSTNGHVVMQDSSRVNAVLAEIAAERQRSPVESEGQEGVVCFRSLKKKLAEAGFAPSQVVTFGSVRGTNALADVARLHVVGRPTPPVDELLYLAQVIHFGEPYVSGQIVLRPEAFGGQDFEVDVIDYADTRLAALLKGVREDEIVQAIHRGRLFSLSDPQLWLVGEEAGERRHQVELVLHTSQPIPGLRVDELILKSDLRDVNGERHENAVQRIRTAVLRLQEQCLPVNVSAVLRLSGGSRTTVTKVLKEGVQTLNRDLLYKGPYTLPNLTGIPISSPPNAKNVAGSATDNVNRCRGGCGRPMPEGQMCFDCATKSVEEYVRLKKTRKGPA